MCAEIRRGNNSNFLPEADCMRLNKKNFLKFTPLIIFLLSISVNTYAEEYFITEEIFVTATRIVTQSKKIGSPISIIDKKEIDKMQFLDLSEALSYIPGLHKVSIGGTGHQTSLFIRGSNSNHSLTLIDGIEMGDPSASSGAFDFGNIFIGLVDRIEVLRGSQASIYGSEAIGGVVNIITPRPSSNYIKYLMQYGSHSTHRESVEISKYSDKIAFLGSLSFTGSNGESLTSSRFRGAGTYNEDDSYQNMSGSIKLGLNLYDSRDIGFVFHYFDTKAELDPTAEDPDSNSTTTQYFAKVESSMSFFENVINNISSINISKINREFLNYPDDISNTFQSTLDDGERVKIISRNDIDYFEHHLLSFGLEYEHEKQDNTQFADFSGFVIGGSSSETAITKTLYLQDTISYKDKLFLITDIRYDKNSRFEGEATYRLSPVIYLDSIRTRFRGAYGTGHRVPALFELFGSSTTAFGDSFRGNRNLQPEESKNWEIGFDTDLSAYKTVFSLTYFNSKIDDLIVASGFPTVPIHSLNAKINGVEAQITIKPSDKINFNTSYTFTSAEDSSLGTSLLRRPKHKLNTDIDFKFSKKLNFFVSTSYIGETSDVGFNGGSVYRGGYVLSNTGINFKASESLRLFGKINNVTDNDHEIADGFRGPGRSIFIGIEKKW